MSYFWIVDILGIFAFSISGFLVGVRKRLDILGISIAAFATALGGGILRDAIVDKIPFAFVENYPFIVVFCSILLAYFFKIHKRDSFERRKLFVVIDSIGLIAFSVTGALVAIELELNIFGVLLLSFITAVGGGILRDVMINEVPFVLTSQFYGIIALLNGGTLFVLHILEVLNPLTIVISSTLALTIRLLAYFRDWHLPKIS